MEDKKYSKLKSVFESTQPQMPADFTERVMKRIAHKRRRLWLFPVIGAVAASLLLLLTLHLNQHHVENGEAIAQWTPTQSYEQPSHEGDESVISEPQTERQELPPTKVLPCKRHSPNKGKVQSDSELKEEIAAQEHILAVRCEGDLATESQIKEEIIVIPPERQALADIYLAEEALQVAYQQQAQVEALRAYANSLVDEETVQEQPVIAF